MDFILQSSLRSSSTTRSHSLTTYVLELQTLNYSAVGDADAALFGAPLQEGVTGRKVEAGDINGHLSGYAGKEPCVEPWTNLGRGHVSL